MKRRAQLSTWLLATVTSMVLLGGAAVLQRATTSGIPDLPVPPPLPARAVQPFTGTARIVTRAVRFKTSLHADVQIPYLEFTPQLPVLGKEISEIRIGSIRIEGLRIIAPIDTIVTPLDPFTPIPGPRLRIGRLSLVDAEIGEMADPSLGIGRWFYHASDLDMELRDVDVAGRRSGPERLRVTRLDFTGDLKGELVQVTSTVATIARTPARLDMQMASSLGLTAFALQSTITPGDDFALELVADTVLFAELHAFESKLPRIGSAKLSFSAAREGDAMRVDVRRATAQIGAAQAAARGRIDTGDAGVVNGLVLQVNNLRQDDVRRAFDLDLPGAGPYSGRIAANGSLRTGVQIQGILESNATSQPSRLALNGNVYADPHAVLDLQLTGDPIRLADTAFTLNLRARGPLDTLGIRGSVRLRNAIGRPVVLAINEKPAPPHGLRSAIGQVDLLLLHSPGAARELRGRVQLHSASDTQIGGPSVLARADGAIRFGGKSGVNAQIHADSLPLSALPWPAEIEDVSGYLQGGLRVQGPLNDPDINGELRVQSGALHVATTGSKLTSINGPLRLRGDRLLVDALTADVGKGTLRASGEAVLLGSAKRLDLALHADDVPVTPREPIYTATGDVRVLGPLVCARAGGTLAIVHSASGRRSATVSGTAVLRSDGALDIDIAADSLPLETLPLPAEQVSHIAGFVRARLALQGTVADPLLDGNLRVVDGGARIRASGTHLTGVEGDVRIDDNVMRTEGLRGRAGAGTVALSGSAHMRGTRALELKLQADSAKITDTDSASIIASASLTVTGSLDFPRLNGRARLVGGWAKEDLLRSDPVVDLDEPPHADLAARVPWLRNSRLLRGRDTAKRTPPFQGEVVVEVTPGIKMVDEDSELYGKGEVRIRADSSGIVAVGDVRFLGGQFNNFGERFRVRGGGALLVENEEPRLTLRGEHEVDELGGRDFGNELPLAWYPGLDLFIIGTTKLAVQQLRRLTPLPQAQTELAATLIYDQPFDPIRGWYNRQFWLPDKPSDFLGKRTEHQGGDLLWSYVADEAYDYLPLSRAALHAATVTIGSRFPGRIVQGPLFRATVNITQNIDVTTSLAPEGTAAPGLRARWHTGALSVSAFDEPKFFAAPPAGHLFPPYFYRRRTGIGLRWDQEF